MNLIFLFEKLKTFLVLWCKQTYFYFSLSFYCKDKYSLCQIILLSDLKKSILIGPKIAYQFQKTDTRCNTRLRVVIRETDVLTIQLLKNAEKPKNWVFCHRKLVFMAQNQKWGSYICMYMSGFPSASFYSALYHKIYYG